MVRPLEWTVSTGCCCNGELRVPVVASVLSKDRALPEAGHSSITARFWPAVNGPWGGGGGGGGVMGDVRC